MNFEAFREMDPLATADEDLKPLLVCRGCLSASRPLRPFGRALANLYDQLVGANGPQADANPQWVCSYCHALLLKFSKFRDKCRSSQDTFLRIQSAAIPVTIDLLKHVSGVPYPILQQTLVQQIDMGGPDQKVPSFEVPIKIEDGNDHTILRPFRKEDENRKLNPPVPKVTIMLEQRTEKVSLNDKKHGNETNISCKEELYEHLPGEIICGDGDHTDLDSDDFKMAVDEFLDELSHSDIYKKASKKPNSQEKQQIVLNNSFLKDDVEFKTESTEHNVPDEVNDCLLEDSNIDDDSEVQSEAANLSVDNYSNNDNSKNLERLYSPSTSSKSKDKYLDRYANKAALQNVTKLNKSIALRNVNAVPLKSYANIRNLKRSALQNVKIIQSKDKYLDCDAKDLNKGTIVLLKTRKSTKLELDNVSLSQMKKQMEYNNIKKKSRKNETLKSKKLRNKKALKAKEVMTEEALKAKKMRKKEALKAKKMRKRQDKTIEDHKKQYETYNFKTILLTKEQQIARIQARKYASNYDEANFKCDLCYRTFITKNTLKNHMERHGSSFGAFICEVCNLRYESKYKVKKHAMSMHWYDYVCNECGTLCKHTTEAFSHYKCHKGVTYDCKICGKSYTKSTSLSSHIRLSHGGSAQCLICHETFIGEMGLKAHMSMSHKQAKGAVCEDCNVQFHSVTALQRHLSAGDHTHRSCCVVCGEGFPTDELLQQHKLDEHQAGFKCDTCDNRYNTLKELRQHFNTHFRTKGVKNTHLSKKGEKGEFICEVCGVAKTSKTNLVTHINTHTKPFECRLCDTSFAYKYVLISHQIRVHGIIPASRRDKPAPEIRCRFCHKKFPNFPNRARHENLVHRKLRPHKCAICESKYTDKAALQMHINTKHLGMPWPKRDRSKGRRKQVAMETQDHAEDGGSEQTDGLQD